MARESKDCPIEIRLITIEEKHGKRRLTEKDTAKSRRAKLASEFKISIPQRCKQLIGVLQQVQDTCIEFEDKVNKIQTPRV